MRSAALDFLSKGDRPLGRCASSFSSRSEESAIAIKKAVPLGQSIPVAIGLLEQQDNE